MASAFANARGRGGDDSGAGDEAPVTSRCPLCMDVVALCSCAMAASYSYWRNVKEKKGPAFDHGCAESATIESALVYVANVGFMAEADSLINAHSTLYRDASLALRRVALRHLHRRGRTRVMAAAATGNIPRLRSLLYTPAGALHPLASVSRADDDHATALVYAVRLGQTEAVEVLTSAGASLEEVREWLTFTRYNADKLKEGDGSTCMQEAVEKADVDAVRGLLGGGLCAGAARDSVFLCNLLRSAVRQGSSHDRVVLALVQAGANGVLDAAGCTLLHTAARRGYTAVVEALVAAGCELDAQSQGGWTALHFATIEGHANIVHVLLKAGAAVDARKGGLGAGDSGGCSALHLAARYGFLDSAAALLAAGASVQAVDAGGRTAALWASLMGHASVGALLQRSSRPKGVGNHG
jgi:ankyrin repeat protein